MKHRLAIILPMYLLTYVLCYYGSFLLRFDFAVPPQEVEVFRLSLPFILVAQLTVSLLAGEWSRTFRYATLSDVLWVAVGSTIAAIIMYAFSPLMLMAGTSGIPRGVILIDWNLCILATSFLRCGARSYNEIIEPLLNGHKRHRTLIYGATKESIGILRTLRASGSDYHVVGFIDGEQSKHNSIISGVPMYSVDVGWKALARSLQAKHVLISSTVPGPCVREVLKHCAEAGLKAHVIPTVRAIVDGRYRLTVRDVTVSDLLRREPAQLDVKKIRKYITGRRVLVTGAAGSIGSELCRQIFALRPESMVLLDQSESGIFMMEQQLASQQDDHTSLHFAVADVVDSDAIARIMNVHRPHLVFHAAAYKHVPLMEQHPQEAIRNNVFGTKNVADLSDRYGVERFVLISTDKAVQPTNNMGATKLIAEKYVQSLSRQSSTSFITVRFGNVLNSAGSVVPIFRRQIEAGGPVTVTHPEMKRFFMTIPEAVQLVLQAGAIGGSGDVLVLDMGEPVKIVDLAKDMIFLSGLKYPSDIEIVFTGVRAGEKLSEELFYTTEKCGTKKVHDRIFCASGEPPQQAQVEQDLARLKQAINRSRQESAATLRSTAWSYATGGAQDTEALKPAA